MGLFSKLYTVSDFFAFLAFPSNRSATSCVTYRVRQLGLYPSPTKTPERKEADFISRSRLSSPWTRIRSEPHVCFDHTALPQVTGYWLQGAGHAGHAGSNLHEEL